MIRISRKIENKLLEKIEALSNQNIFACYFCGTCSSSCPFSEELDLTPDRVIRYILFGKSEVLDCKTPWVCASCFICSVRCPRNIDLPKVMEALRQIKLRKNIDRIELSRLLPEELAELPQLAFVSCFKRKTG